MKAFGDIRHPFAPSTDVFLITHPRTQRIVLNISVAQHADRASLLDRHGLRDRALEAPSGRQ